ncbi:MAG: Gfo/Idh/MocA family oxidoreductase [Firmicutes bacterium]|nr:Gfo/Idh/MocA family oxidoreductase [Bacillota bacterium]
MAKFNILLVGCGGMGHVWIKCILQRQDCRVLGLCDIIPEKARKMKEDYTGQGLADCAVFGNITDALAAGLGFNVVIDCTTPEAHEHVVTGALKAGCDVLGEKPMAATREEALNQIKTADACGRRYSVMQNRIYLPGMRTLRKAVDDKIIGRLGFIGSSFFIGAHFGGFRDLMDNVLVLDMAIHTFYQARFIAGSNPVSVYCHEFNPPGSWYKGAANAVAIFEFENGVVYNYQGSWCAEGHNTTWECDWRLCGEVGSIKWDGKTAPVAQIVKPGATGFMRPFDEHILPLFGEDLPTSHAGCIDEMFAALNENRPAETDCHENYYSMNMVYGAIESAKLQKKVWLR